MADLSKTARASMKSGKATEVDLFDTNEKKIRELRKNLVAHLWVRPDFIEALLEEYDDELGQSAKLETLSKGFQMRVEELKGDIQILQLQLAAAQTGNFTTGEPSESERLQANLEPLPKPSVPWAGCEEVEPIEHHDHEHGGEG